MNHYPIEKLQDAHGEIKKYKREIELKNKTIEWFRRRCNELEDRVNKQDNLIPIKTQYLKELFELVGLNVEDSKLREKLPFGVYLGRYLPSAACTFVPVPQGGIKSKGYRRMKKKKLDLNDYLEALDMGVLDYVDDTAMLLQTTVATAAAITTITAALRLQEVIQV